MNLVALIDVQCMYIYIYKYMIMIMFGYVSIYLFMKYPDVDVHIYLHIHIHMFIYIFRKNNSCGVPFWLFIPMYVHTTSTMIVFHRRAIHQM